MVLFQRTANPTVPGIIIGLKEAKQQPLALWIGLTHGLSAKVAALLPRCLLAVRPKNHDPVPVRTYTLFFVLRPASQTRHETAAAFANMRRVTASSTGKEIMKQKIKLSFTEIKLSIDIQQKKNTAHHHERQVHQLPQPELAFDLPLDVSDGGEALRARSRDHRAERAITRHQSYRQRLRPCMVLLRRCLLYTSDAADE